jgi:hypothetical protein
VSIIKRIGPGKATSDDEKFGVHPVCGFIVNSKTLPRFVGSGGLPLFVNGSPSPLRFGPLSARMRSKVMVVSNGPVYTVVPKFTTEVDAMYPTESGIFARNGLSVLQLVKPLPPMGAATFATELEAPAVS